MLIEQKLRREDDPLRRREDLSSLRAPVALFILRNVPRLAETAMAAIEVLGVEAEVPIRFLDQMRTRAEKRKVVNADDDIETVVDELQHIIERHTVHSFEMDRARTSDGDGPAHGRIKLRRNAPSMPRRLRYIDCYRTDDRHTPKAP